MKYGPGRSFKLWDEYFTHPEAQLYYLEQDGKCVEDMKIQPRNGKVFIGSQGDPEFMQQVAEELASLGGLDILVDDGGHRMNFQLLTMQSMWPVIRPGGLLIVEDIHTSYLKDLGGTKDVDVRTDHTIARPSTSLGRIAELIDVLNCDVSGEECDKELLTVYCYRRTCALRKANPATEYRGPKKGDK